MLKKIILTLIFALQLCPNNALAMQQQQMQRQLQKPIPAPQQDTQIIETTPQATTQEEHNVSIDEPQNTIIDDTAPTPTNYTISSILYTAAQWLKYAVLSTKTKDLIRVLAPMIFAIFATAYAARRLPFDLTPDAAKHYINNGDCGNNFNQALRIIKANENKRNNRYA